MSQGDHGDDADHALRRADPALGHRNPRRVQQLAPQQATPPWLRRRGALPQRCVALCLPSWVSAFIVSPGTRAARLYLPRRRSYVRAVRFAAHGERDRRLVLGTRSFCPITCSSLMSSHPMSISLQLEEVERRPLHADSPQLNSLKNANVSTGGYGGYSRPPNSVNRL